MKKYTVEELRVGMRVHVEELSEIYDTLIILDEKIEGSGEGEVVFIGKEGNEESQRAVDSCTIVVPVYNDSMLVSGKEIII